MSDHSELHQILEAALFTAGEPLSAEKLQQMFDSAEAPSVKQIKETLAEIATAMEDRGVELVEVASGYRFQSKAEYSGYIQKLWNTRPPRYSRALLETLALIIYKQPITRGEIEEIRGVAVSSNIVKTMLEREWIKIAGHRDVPGKPALYATTKQLLDYFNLKKLSDFPPLKDVVNLDELGEALGLQLALDVPDSTTNENAEAAEAESLTADDTEEAEVNSQTVTEQATSTDSPEADVQAAARSDNVTELFPQTDPEEESIAIEN